ncbi:MAG: biotin--[acetyl-CoA-carboxylase] ligase [Pseudomonadota bacterium]
MSNPGGVPCFSFGDVGSTNDEAFRIAREQNFDLFFVTGERQLQGRGRRGRPWVSEKGNLYTSIYLREPSGPDAAPGLSFVTAVALHEAVSDLCGPEADGACRVKWPNDLLWKGAKIAGLLLEARHTGNRLDIVIGIGVNCSHAPEDTPYQATSLRAEGQDVPADQLFDALRPAFLANLHLWNRGANFGAIREKWLQRAIGLGDAIVVRLDERDFRGQFRDLDAAGRLILQEKDGTERIISAGDVFFN